MVKAAAFVPAASPPKPEPDSPPVPPEATAGDDEVTKLRRLALLRDAGMISEEAFAAKKSELLSRV
jgi:hypothetical protein